MAQDFRSIAPDAPKNPQRKMAKYCKDKVEDPRFLLKKRNRSFLIENNAVTNSVPSAKA